MTLNSVKTLYLIINKINGNIKESNENIYMMLLPADENKQRHTLQEINENKNNSGDNLTLKKTHSRS